jgi:hypothetical protein
VQRKGERLARMLDGVLPTPAASIYRVHSESGQVEFRWGEGAAVRAAMAAC